MASKPARKTKPLPSAGIDIGSRTVKLVLLQDGNIVHWEIAETGSDPLQQALKLIAGKDFDAILATGYGRGLLEKAKKVPTITELKAHAAGARFLFPDCRTVLDLGGQDTKAISLDADGRITDFEINDRCAAGTGKFLEVMAEALGYDLEEFGKSALSVKHGQEISSTCTVFAESEVTGLLARGVKPAEVAWGLHQAVVRRVVAMLRRLPTAQPLVFAGGGAKNPALVKLLGAEWGELHIPSEPQIVGALGAAILAQEK
jgi:predicted CoA-substrate-specific enzyme activase